jgi:indole-3-glycerol phosphate synthase
VSTDFIRTQTVLDRILDQKVKEIAAQKAVIPLTNVMHSAALADPPRDFAAVLRRDTVALIAEAKHASPSRGVLIDPFDPVDLGTTYAANGAAAISVLTDETFFQGHLDYLRAIQQAVTIPVLRKEFVIDPYQVYEGRAAGADAILLIASALADGQIAELHAQIRELGMVALVEVHNEQELERVLPLNPTLIGVNNRDLKIFHVDIDTTARLARQVPAHVTLVAESGIHTVDDIRRMADAGAHAVLVGEALVQAKDIAAKVRELSGVTR